MRALCERAGCVSAERGRASASVLCLYVCGWLCVCVSTIISLSIERRKDLGGIFNLRGVQDKDKRFLPSTSSSCACRGTFNVYIKHFIAFASLSLYLNVRRSAANESLLFLSSSYPFAHSIAVPFAPRLGSRSRSLGFNAFNDDRAYKLYQNRLNVVKRYCSALSLPVAVAANIVTALPLSLS